MVVGAGGGTRPSDRVRSRNSTAPDREVGLVTTPDGTVSVNMPPMVGATGGHVTDNKKHRLKSRFQVVKKLGQGTYGKVQLAVNKETGQQVAIKTIKKSKIESEQDLVRIRREIQIMSSIQHPHIIHIFEVFENKDKIVLVMQYASGGELYEYVSARKVLSDQDARRLFRQIATAIYYCHKNKVCHRDLKLENILLDEKGNAKIGDFGLSNVFDERHHLTTFCGSPLYASPEIVKGTPYYGPEVDCWSMGVLLYTLVYGAMPFDGSNFKRLVKQISEANYFEPKSRSEASPLIRRLLAVNPKKRASIIDICADPWVNSGFDTSLLTLAEDMANLTPVRLDILLALAPMSPKDAPILNETDEDTTLSTKLTKQPDTSECDFITAAEIIQKRNREASSPQSQATAAAKASDSASEMASIEFIPSLIAAALEADRGESSSKSTQSTNQPSGVGKRPATITDSSSQLQASGKNSAGDVTSKRKKAKSQIQQEANEKSSNNTINVTRIDSPCDAEKLSSSGYASEAATSILEPNSRRESVFSYSEEGTTAGSQQLNIPQASTSTDNQVKVKAKLDDALHSSLGPKQQLLHPQQQQQQTSANRVNAKNTFSSSLSPVTCKKVSNANESTISNVSGDGSASAVPISSKDVHKVQQGSCKPIAEVKPKQRPLASTAQVTDVECKITDSSPAATPASPAQSSDNDKSIKQTAGATSTSGADRSPVTSSVGAAQGAIKKKNLTSDKKAAGSAAPIETVSPQIKNTPDTHKASQSNASATSASTAASQQEIEQKKVKANEPKQKSQNNAPLSSVQSSIDGNSATPTQTASAAPGKPTLEVSAVKSITQYDGREKILSEASTDSTIDVTASQASTPSESLADEPVSRRSSLKSSQGSLASGQSKHPMLERRSMSVNSASSGKRVGRLSIPSFLEIQDKTPSLKKPVPSYGSVSETKKKLLERKESIQSESSAEVEHIFPTIPVKEAKTDVERRSSLADPLPLQKGPNGIRLNDNEPDPEIPINRTGRKVVVRRSTEPLIRQETEVSSSSSIKSDLTRDTIKKAISPLTEENELVSSPSPERNIKQEKTELHLVIGKNESSSTVTTGAGDVSPSVATLNAKPAPITRSYKKVTFTKDGACITETGKVISQPGPNGTVTRIEQKSKVTHYPSGVETVSSNPRLVEISSLDSSDDVNSVKNSTTSASSSNTAVPNISSRVSSSSGIKKSESASSSGSTDIFDDIFDTWTSDTSMLFGGSRIKSIFPSPLFARRSASRNRSGRSSVERNIPPRQMRGESLERPATETDDLFSSQQSPAATADDESPFGPLFRGFSHMPSNMRSLLEKHKSIFAHPFNSAFDSPLRSSFDQNDAPHDDLLSSPIIRTPLASTFTCSNPLASSQRPSTSSGNRVMNVTVSVDPGRKNSSSTATSSSDATIRPEEEEESEDSVASRRRVEQWLDTSPDTGLAERAASTASSSIYATIRPRPVSRYTRTLSSSVYDDADDADASENASANVAGGVRRPVVQMRLTLNPGGISTGSRIVYSATPHSDGEMRSRSALDHTDDLVIPESSSLLEQLRTHGYKNLVSQRLSGLRNPPASFPDVYPGPYKKAAAAIAPSKLNTPTPNSLNCHQVHRPSAWVQAQSDSPQINQSTLQITDDSSHLTSHPDKLTSLITQRKRIDQMTDKEIKQLINSAVKSKEHEESCTESNKINENKVSDVTLAREANKQTESRVISPACTSDVDCNAQNPDSVYNLQLNATQRQITNELPTRTTKYSTVDAITVQQAASSSTSGSDNRIETDAHTKLNCENCSPVDHTSLANGATIDDEFHNLYSPCINPTGRSDSPSLEQLIEAYRSTGVTVRPKIWPRVRKEPLFAPLWETQSTRDSPISDSLVTGKSSASTVASVANNTCTSPISASSPSPFSPPSSCLAPPPPAAATCVDASTNATSIVESDKVHETFVNTSDDTCMLNSNVETVDTGTCVASPTTINNLSSSSPSLDSYPSHFSNSNASCHVYFTCGDANSNSNSTRSSIHIRSQPKLTSHQKISSTHLSDRSRRLNQRRCNQLNDDTLLHSMINTDHTNTLLMCNTNFGDEIPPYTDGTHNGHDGTNTNTNTDNTNSPSTSNSSITDHRNAAPDHCALPPKHPLSGAVASSNGNEETVRERIHRKSFYQRFNDEAAVHNSPRYKSASPARRRSSFLEGDDYVQVNTNDRTMMRRCFSHNPSPSPTPGTSGNRRPIYNQSVSCVDRKDSINNGEWLSRMESKTHQMLNDMRNQIGDVRESTVNHNDPRRRSSSLLRNTSKITASRPHSHYNTLDDTDSDDDDYYATSRPVNYPARIVKGSGLSHVHHSNYK